MKTSPRQTSPSGEDELTSLPEVSPASLFPTQENGGGERTSVTSGRRCSALLTKSGPLGSLVKTLLVSPLWSKEGYSLTWEARQLYSTRETTFTDTRLGKPSPSRESAVTLGTSDIPSSRCLFRLRLSELPTEGTGSSSLLMPTPLATDIQHRKRVEELKESGAEDMYSRANGDSRPNSLMDYLHFNGLLKTPCAMDAGADSRKSRGVSGTSGTLAQEIASGYVQKRGFMLPTPETQGLKVCEGGRRKFLRTDLLPTPTAGEAEKYRLKYTPGSQMGQSLSAMGASGMLPTPQTSDAGEPLTAEQKEKYVGRWMKKGIMPSAAYQLRQQAAEGLLPTPRANNMTELNLANSGVVRERTQGKNLEEVVAKALQEEMLPTPSARDWKGKTNPGVVKEGSGTVYGETLPDTIGRLTEASDRSTDGKPSRLSPLFTEEMMGFPFMWTTLPFLSQSGGPSPSKPTETP